MNKKPVDPGYYVKDTDRIVSTDLSFEFDHYGDEKPQRVLLMLNKPAGYVCSRNGQGSKTVYDLLPKKYHYLKTIGRLDKDSSGLLLLTNDGELANKLTHPRYQKSKVYEVSLNKELKSSDQSKLQKGVSLDNGLSRFSYIKSTSANKYEVTLSEGRNRQIRRTFEAIGYRVSKLHRTDFGSYSLGGLPIRQYNEQNL